MLPIVEDFINRFRLDYFVIVAESGLMSSRNIKQLDECGYKYIIGARIKNETQKIKQWILAQPKVEGEFQEISKENVRLIIGYSTKRAKRISIIEKKASPA